MCNVVLRKIVLLLCSGFVQNAFSNFVEGRELDTRQIHYTTQPTPRPLGTGDGTDPLSLWIQRAQSAAASPTTSSSSPSSSSASSLRPNVLFLVADDLRPRLGCYDDPEAVTPNIDQLAQRSVVFKQAFVQQALCGPSRTSFLTGRRPDSTRCYDLTTYWRRVAGNFTTLPQFFRERGYLTQGVGKVFHPGNSGGDDDARYSWSEKSFRGFQPVSYEKRHKSTMQAVNESETGLLQDTTIADFAVRWLRDNAAPESRDHRPFFLAVGFHKPHLPFLYPKQFNALHPLEGVSLAEHRARPQGVDDVVLSGNGEFHTFADIRAFNYTDPMTPLPDQYQRRLRQAYLSATSFTDSLVGRVLEALSDAGLANTTIVSFLGDHGYHLGDNALWGKHTNFDAATRIPLMLSIPGVTSNMTSYRHIDALSEIVTSIDHPATSPIPNDAILMSSSKSTDSTLKSWSYPELGSDALVTSSSSLLTSSPPTLQSDALVEAVDLFPTLAELAGFQAPATCPSDNMHVATCVEGTSLVPVLRDVMASPSLANERRPGGREAGKEAAFSQYLRRADETAFNFTVMGYSLRTTRHRYAEWVRFDDVAYRGDWGHVVARELYDHVTDPEERDNLAAVRGHEDVMLSLSRLLRMGWRAVQDTYTLHIQ